MKQDKHQWEGELRQRVTDHEFGYEPEGWGELAQLLDEVVIPTDAKPGPSSDFGFGGLWKVGVSALILVGAISIWYLQETPAPIAPTSTPPPTIELTTAPVLNEPFESEDLGSGKGLEEIQEQKQVKRVESGEKKSQKVLPTPISLTPISPMPEEAINRTREKVILLPPLPPRKDLPLLEEKAIGLELDPLSPIRSKRKRDRKKLYPEVIDNY